jgi:hypothetical protein
MTPALRFLLSSACIAALAGCGGGGQEPAATPDAAAAAAAAAAASSAATAALASVRPLVVAESMVARVTAPSRPNNGKLVLNPGIRPRDLHEPAVPVPTPAGARGARTLLSGG